MQGGTEHVARCVAGTSQLTIGITALNNHATEVQGVEHLFASLLNGHALLFTQFGKEFSIFLLFRTGSRVNDSSLVNVAKAPLLSETMNFVNITKNNEVSHTISKNAVCGFKGAFFRTFGKNNALLVSFSTRDKLFNEFHKRFYVYSLLVYCHNALQS